MLRGKPGRAPLQGRQLRRGGGRSRFLLPRGRFLLRRERRQFTLHPGQLGTQALVVVGHRFALLHLKAV